LVKDHHVGTEELLQEGWLRKEIRSHAQCELTQEAKEKSSLAKNKNKSQQPGRDRTEQPKPALPGSGDGSCWQSVPSLLCKRALEHFRMKAGLGRLA